MNRGRNPLILIGEKMPTTEQKEKILNSKKNKRIKKEVKRFHTGDWVLDCILSDSEESKEKGFPLGKVVHLWGASKSGKSFLCLNAIYAMLATYGKKNVDYLWIDVERAFDINSEELYGFSVNDNEHISYANTVEKWQAVIETWVEGKDPNRPKIIVLDSLDTLSVSEELARKDDRIKHYKKDGGTGEQKTYGMEKAKKISETLRTSMGTLADNNTTMFVISQERTNVNATMFQKSTTVSGGKGPGFYSTVQLELKPTELYGDKYRPTGGCVQAHAVKSRTPFEARRALISLDYKIGFDVIGSAIDDLYSLRDEYGKLDEKKCQALKWVETFDLNNLGGDAVSDKEIKQFAEDNGFVESVREEFSRLTAKNIQMYISKTPEFRNKFVEQFGVMSRDDLIQWIEEEEEREIELEKRVKSKFYHIENNLRPQRKSRKLID